MHQTKLNKYEGSVGGGGGKSELDGRKQTIPLNCLRFLDPNAIWSESMSLNFHL